MINYKTLLVKGISLLLLCNTANALNPPTAFTLIGNNGFIFFENDLDKEYFIASTVLDPRFTGANTWTKHGKNNQDSLGYMGTNASFTSNYHVDMWLEDSDMSYPFQGIRCRLRAANDCPASGFIPPVYTDQYGVYKMLAGSSEYSGHNVRGSFSPQAYEYLKNSPINSVNTFIMHDCQTTENYDPTLGERCQNAKTGLWRKSQFNITKEGHVKFYDTRAFHEIWIATDGTPTFIGNSDLCKPASATGGTLDQQQGIACTMLRYSIDGVASGFSPYLRFYMVVDTDLLDGIVLNPYDIRLDGGNGEWKLFNYNGAANELRYMFTSGEGYVRVLFTKAFFQKMIAKGITTAGRKDVFTFAIDNTVAPQSGYYQFGSGVQIDMIPREYSISIRPQDDSEKFKTGKIGTSEDIIFNYKVTQSAPRKADVVTAAVIGESTVRDTTSYCLFKSSDQQLRVAIPAYLSYTHASGGLIEQYSGCNANATLDLTDAIWDEVAWDVNQSGYFYSTNLTLRFPMDDPISLSTIDGVDWLGSVHAEGDVKVEAKWIGVDK